MPQPLRQRRLPRDALDDREQHDEDEHVLADNVHAGSADGRSPTRRGIGGGVASPSLRRKLQQQQEQREQGAPVSGSSSKGRSRALWACMWLLVYALLVPTLCLLAAAWKQYRSPHPIGFGAAWVSVMTHLFPLIEHDEEHRFDLEALKVSRARLDKSNALNYAPAIAGVEDILVPSTKGNHSIPVRLFRPLRPAEGKGKETGTGGLQRAIVWIHGGGWTVGSIEADDNLARRLAAASGAIVASVEYRLAPEHKYPAQLEDTQDALEYVLAQGRAHGIDTARVAVAGESAGGHLTIVTALALGEAAKERLCGIIPVVPATDYGCDSDSCRRFSEGYLLTRGQVKAFWRAKLSDPEAEQHHHFVSPLRAPAETLAALPPMLVLTAGLDPLRDEGEAFAAKAREAGVPTELVRYERTIHGFFGRMVTNGHCGVQQAAVWFERVCGGEQGQEAELAAA